MTAMSEERACPWCGDVGVSYEEQSTYRWGAAVCDDCGVVGPEIRKQYGEAEADWAPRALEAWNRRAASPADAQLLEALQGLVAAVIPEVNEKGAGGYLLARLADARAALASASAGKEKV